MRLALCSVSAKYLDAVLPSIPSKSMCVQSTSISIGITQAFTKDYRATEAI
jgi:hypothetical protein